MSGPVTGRVVTGRVVTGRVVVVGDLVTDVLAVVCPASAGRNAIPLAAGSDTPATIRLIGGGQAANTAAWLARCGVPVTLVAAVGDDPAGRERVAELVAAGVDCAVRSDPDAPTGTLVVLASDADRSMVTDRGAADRLRPDDVDAALDRLTDARHLHLSGYALLGEGSRAAGRHALVAARARGLTTSVDAASAAPLRAVGAAAFRDWIQGIDLLLANADEAAVLGDPAGVPPPPARVADTVVVKLGAAGARWSADQEVRVGVPPVTVVDPTGAGDAFAAGLLTAWLAGADPADALRAGARLGAEAVTTLGPRPS